ncbi:MAG TPA: hypothetical protein VJ952_05965 [Opitutales bacterium]|nr:hypothetical protein [Opitutales bacterium]
METVLSPLRRNLSLTDIKFIANCLGKSPEEDEALWHLLVDADTVDSILDQPKLLQTVLESYEHLSISSRLYFYLVTRHSLRSSGLDDAELADYVSGVLDANLTGPRIDGHRQAIFYVVDWLQQLEACPDDRRYQLYVSAGNYLLYLTGVFPQFLNERTRRRGAPGLAYYEDFARFSFRSASQYPDNPLAEPRAELYEQLAENFSEVRHALNDLSERLIHLDS